MITQTQLADDLQTSLADRLPEDVISQLAGDISSATVTGSYPANGSVASIVFWMKWQCVITGGKTFNGESWGIAFPGGGALIGDVYTDDLARLYANTVSFAFTATPVYTALYFYDGNSNLLGHFQAGSVSTVAGAGGGSGSWS